jgi:hypothetical protein
VAHGGNSIAAEQHAEFRQPVNLKR